MVEEHSIIQMDRNMKVNGMKMYVKVKEYIRIRIMIRMMVNGKITKDKEKERIHMQRQVCVKFILIEKSFFVLVEAQYIGTWNNGKRQGPGEMQFAQYRYVGKFNENYV